MSQNLMSIADEGWDAFPEWIDIAEITPTELRPPERAPIPSTPHLTPTPVATYGSDARPSATPVPFRIPVEVRPTIPPSRHLLRILRSTPRPFHAAPDLRAALVAPIAPIHARARALYAGIAQLTGRWRTRVPLPPTPVLRILPPYDELLITHVVAGTLGVLWRSIGWPLVVRLGCRELGARAWRFGRRSVAVDLRAFRAAIRGAIAFPALRNAVTFALTLLIVLLPLKLSGTPPFLRAARGRVLGATAVAVDALRDGSIALTHSSFTEAITAFDDARRVLDALPDAAGSPGRLGVTVGRYLPGIGSSIRRSDDLRRAGIALAAASSTATRGMAMLAALDLRAPERARTLDAARAAFASARMLGETARGHLADADPTLALPLDRALAQLRRAESILPILGALSGVDRPRRILLAFQNPHELRPTGGFLGSVALLDVRAGHVEALELPDGGTYDLSGLSRLRVLPPEPLRLLSETWQLHDANWFPDFPTTARKLRAFSAASGEPSVDAVVAVNAPVLASILTATGPITIGDRTFGASDVLAVLTNTVEDPTARATGAPKAILRVLAPALLERLVVLAGSDRTIADRLALLDLLLRALDERDILLAFTDNDTQRAVTAAGWAGDLPPAPRDVLRIVHTNIGGGKSDARTRDALTHTATVLADGTVLDTVTLTRTHEGSAPGVDTPSERLMGFPNVDYLRVYVPRGAELLSAEGFTDPPHPYELPPTDAIPDADLLATELRERRDPMTGLRVTEEFGRTAFGGWLIVPPHEARTIRLVYRLPWRYARTTRGLLGARDAPPQLYALRIEQQPGTRPTIRHAVELHAPWVATWTSANLRSMGPHVWTLEDILTTDRVAGMLLAPRGEWR